MKELLKNQLPKLAYGLFAMFAICLFIGLIIGTVLLIICTHGIIQVVVIAIVVLFFAWMIGNEYF